MTSKSISRRPPFYGQLSSSSLQGMERTSSEKSPLVENYRDKPLPPAPRKRSSIYSLQPEDIIDVYAQIGPEDELLPPHVFRPRDTHSLTRIKNAQMGRLQSDLGHGYRIQSAPDTSASSRNDERPKLRMEKSTPANVKVYLDRGTNLPLTRREQQKSKTSTEESEMIHTANDAADLLAKEYRAAFSNRPITIPDYRTTQYRSEHDHPPTPLSARITDVVDHSLMPSPLRISQISRSERPSSHFSSSSSNADSIHDGIRGSFRAYARKVLNVPKASAEDTEKKRIMSVASAKYPHMNLDLTKRSRLSSVASQGSASIQQGLSNMYDTLTSLSVGSSKAKPTIDIASTKRKDIVRERRSPAIPVTPYQHLGRKAWETPKSPKQKSPKKIFPFLPRSRSNATRFGRPTGQDPLRRTNSERRREELKKKIVVIGATDPYSVGRVSHWL